MGNNAGPAMPRAGDIEHIQIILLDDAIEMDVNEIEAGRRPPVSQQPRLDVLNRERYLEQRIVVQINLADGQIIGSSPIGVHLLQ